MRTKTQRNNEIKRKKMDGVTMSALAKEYGVSESRISQIVYAKRPYKKRAAKFQADAVTNLPKADNSFTVKVTIPQSDIGAMLTVLAQRNYQFTVSA